MPFVLCNATATFQRLMAQALMKVTKKYRNLVMCYVDDVVIGTSTLADHIDRLDEVFNCMKTAGLKCKSSKCEILRDSTKYLGRMVDRHGVRSDPEALEAGLTWKAPRTDTELMSFHGFANYYRELMKGYADKLYPMQQLMRNEEKKFELAKVWCVKMEDATHQPNVLNSQMRVMKTYLKARYRLTDLLRAQRNDRMTSNLK